MLENLNGETRLFPLIGDPVHHAKSPQLLTRSFEARGANALCIAMQVRAADMEAVMHGLARVPTIGGVLVTMPLKFAAFDHCATTTEAARRMRIVCVMRRNADGSWHGDNTDGRAFVKAQQDHGARTQGARALLIGAGGAGSSIALALLNAGVRDLVIHDRDEARATRLRDLLTQSHPAQVRLGPADPTGCDMVCNATPMGMAPGDPLPLDPALLRPSMFVGDVVAGDGVTPLLQAARATGCRTANGVNMVEAVQQMMVDFLLGA